MHLLEGYIVPMLQKRSVELNVATIISEETVKRAAVFVQHCRAQSITFHSVCLQCSKSSINSLKFTCSLGFAYNGSTFIGSDEISVEVEFMSSHVRLGFTLDAEYKSFLLVNNFFFPQSLTIACPGWLQHLI